MGNLTTHCIIDDVKPVFDHSAVREYLEHREGIVGGG